MEKKIDRPRGKGIMLHAKLSRDLIGGGDFLIFPAFHLLLLS